MNRRRLKLIAMVAAALCVVSVVSCLIFPITGGALWIANSNLNSNRSTPFYGVVVDQEGRPVANADVEIETICYQSEIFSASRRKGDPAVSTRRESQYLHTDANGRFEADIYGIYVTVADVSKRGYLWLYDLESAQSQGYEFGSGRSLFQIGKGFRPGVGPYMPVKENPAQFVLVADGVRSVTALPSPGGQYMVDSSGPVYIGHPVKPRKPSIARLTYPTTQP